MMTNRRMLPTQHEHHATSRSTGLNMSSIKQQTTSRLRRARDVWLAVISIWLITAAGAACAAQKVFATPDDAVAQFVASAKATDMKGLIDVLGPGGKRIIQSGDAIADKAALARFVQAYDEAHKVENSGDSKAILSVGKDAWPFPVPIVKAADGWRFDAKQGAEELLNRRIGRNELSVIQVVEAYVDAQREYYLRNPSKDKLLHYAQQFVSSKGKRDGLYFPVASGEQASPLGALFASATAQGYKAGTAAKPNAYHGYYYRILKSQGPDAKGGAYDYIAQGRMIGGFALVAYPATYGNSGIMTFIVNHDGVVFQKNLGPNTAAIAAKMTKFNPDSTWQRVP